MIAVENIISSKLHEPRSTHHLHPVDQTIGVGFSGLYPDGVMVYACLIRLLYLIVTLPAAGERSTDVLQGLPHPQWLHHSDSGATSDFILSDG